MTPHANRAGVLSAVVGLVLFLACGAGAIAQLDALHADHARLRARGEPLYLPSATTLRIASLGNRTLAADLLYLWSIQYFGDTVSRSDRPWIGRVYELITDLDPHFRDAYWLGFVSLLIEASDPQAAFELAEKAMANEPGFRLLTLEAALTARRLGDIDRAERYLAASARTTGDPLVHRLYLSLREVEWTQDELADWRALLESDDETNRAIARGRVRDLENHVAKAELEALVSCFERRTGRPPRALDELVDAGLISAVPVDASGKPFIYDRASRSVAPSTPPRFKPPTRARRGVDLSHLGPCAPPEAGDPRLGSP